MPSDAQLTVELGPQPSKFRLMIQHWVRVIIPLAASILFLVLSNRLGASRTVPTLHSLGNRLWFVAPTALCSALSALFLLWFCLAIGDDEPHWAAAITTFGATGLPRRRRRWSFFGSLCCWGYIAATAVDMNARIAVAWPLKAREVTQEAHYLSWVLFFVILLWTRLGSKQVNSNSHKYEGEERSASLSGQQD